MPTLFVKWLSLHLVTHPLQKRWEKYSEISLVLYICPSWVEQQGGQATQSKVTETLLSRLFKGNVPHKEMLTCGITSLLPCIPIA